VARGPGSDHRDIFQAHASKVRIIETGFNRDHIAGLQSTAGTGAHPRSVVDFQAEAVTGAMEKTLHPSGVPAGGITLRDEKILNDLVNFLRRRVRPDFAESQHLSAQNRVV